MVVRIAGRLLEQVVNREFDQDFDINTRLLDVCCEGSGSAQGEVSLNFAGATLEEALPLRVRGTMFSRAKGYAGPVVSTARSNTSFEAVFRINYDGTNFYQASSWVSADCDSTIESICPRRRIGRRLIQSVAWRVAPGQVPRYDQAASRHTEGEIDRQAREMIQKQLSELNKAVQFEGTLSAFAAEGYQRRVSKTDTYIQVQVAPEGRDAPQPPRSDLLSEAPLEIWIHPNSDRPLLADLAMKYGTTQTPLSQLLPFIPEAVGQQEVSTEIVDDWDVIKVGRLPRLRGATDAE